MRINRITKGFLTIKKPAQSDRFLEAPPRFELGIRVLQTHALPLGYSAECSYFCETVSLSYKSKNFAPTVARAIGADYEARTRYLHLGKVALYRMS